MTTGLLRATVKVGALTLISRVLGFLRDMVIARIFGSGAATDAFFVAFKIPNFLRRLFAEGAFAQAFVPVLAEYRLSRSEADIQDLVDHVAGILASVLLGVTVAGIALAPGLILLFAPGFTGVGTTFDLAVTLLRITFPYLFFIALTAFAGGILNSYGRFAVPALTPVWLNLTLMGAAWWLAPHCAPPILALAWGVFLAGGIQFAFQLPFLRGLTGVPRPRWRRGHAGVKRLLKQMLPVLFGSSVTQLNLLINTVLASFLVTGSVSWLYYSDRLVELPLGVFGIALATVILPRLSEHHTRAVKTAYSHTLDWGLRWVLVMGCPATVGLVLLAKPILTTLFQHGAFTFEDTLKTSYSVMGYGVGLLPFILVKVLANGFYARQDTRTPMRAGLIAVAANVALNLLLVRPLAHAGLALATSLSALLNAALLYRALRQQRLYCPRDGWFRLLGQIAVAGAVMASVLSWGPAGPEQWESWSVPLRAGKLLEWMAAGLLIYGGTAATLGLRWRHLQLAEGP